MIRAILLLTPLVVATGTYAAVPETELSGSITIDGSSTVYPITEAAAEEFGRNNRSVLVTVGIGGTGGGFKKFCSNEIDISNASRPIRDTERQACLKSGIEYIELPIAYDALTVVVNPKNTWVKSITTADLKKIWAPEAQGKITRWNQVRPEWPDKPLKLFGPGTDSGTFDYFTEAIMGKQGASRGDYTSSEDDNVLVQGVSSEEGGLGYFGLAYYQENKDKLQALAVDDGIDTNGKGPQLPSVSTVESNTYHPLARPLFIYINSKAMARPEVSRFVSFYLKEGGNLTREVGYLALPTQALELVINRLEKRVTGSIYSGGHSESGVSLQDLLKRNQSAS